jgi:hypothetical protein
MYHTLDFAQQDRNISDQMLNRPYNRYERFQEQEAEQNYNRMVLNNVFPMQEQERIAYNQIRIPRNYSNEIVYPSPQPNIDQLPKWVITTAIIFVVVIILALIIGILGIIAIFKKH